MQAGRRRWGAGNGGQAGRRGMSHPSWEAEGPSSMQNHDRHRPSMHKGTGVGSPSSSSSSVLPPSTQWV